MTDFSSSPETASAILSDLDALRRKMATEIVEANDCGEVGYAEGLCEMDELFARCEAALRSFRHAQTPREPVAYLHTLHMELGQTQRKLMFTEPSPFGIPGKHYDATYTVSCTPLYADTSTDRELLPLDAGLHNLAFPDSSPEGNNNGRR